MAEECWTSPVSDDQVTPEVKQQYDQIKDSILSIPWSSGVVAIRRYFQELIACIQMKAAIHPTLARVVARDMHHSSMLTLLCDKAHTPLAHSTMKFLIERNPSALLWKRDNWEKMGIEYSMPIYTMANHHAHHVLLPWIAQHFPWVFEHPDCQARPPTFDFIAQCVNGIALNSALIRQYFTNYPQALSHVDQAQKSNPLHYFLGGFTECRLELFQWLVQKCPSSLFQQNAQGWTPLHAACCALAESPTNNMKEICKFIIERAPQTVHIAAFNGELPIHILKNRQNNAHVQEIILTLLRKYPESHSMATNDPKSYPTPGSHVFVATVVPFILEEQEVQESIVQLRKMPASLSVAFGGGADHGLESVCKVFSSWSKSKLDFLESRLKEIANELELICKSQRKAKDTTLQALFLAPGATETEPEYSTTEEGEEDDLGYCSDGSC